MRREGPATDVTTVNRPSFLLRLYAVLTFPFAVKGSAVWWWRMHENTHAEVRPSCPFCRGETGR